jgi:hypothetical protein
MSELSLAAVRFPHLICRLLDIGNVLGGSVLAFAHHLRRECVVWNPLGGIAWGSLLHHAVNLLEGQTLGLWDQEVCVDECTCAKSTPNEEDRGLEVTVGCANHVWCDNGNDGVPEPVAGS